MPPVPQPSASQAAAAAARPGCGQQRHQQEQQCQQQRQQQPGSKTSAHRELMMKSGVCRTGGMVSMPVLLSCHAQRAPTACGRLTVGRPASLGCWPEPGSCSQSRLPIGPSVMECMSVPMCPVATVSQPKRMALCCRAQVTVVCLSAWPSHTCSPLTAWKVATAGQCLSQACSGCAMLLRPD